MYRPEPQTAFPVNVRESYHGQMDDDDDCNWEEFAQFLDDIEKTERASYL